jgi:hypothetical protein
MSQITHALIEHRLTPDEILEIPNHLRHISDEILRGQWRWSAPYMSKQTLIELWSRKAEFFINNLWSEKDLGLLQKDNLTLQFFEPHLVIFDNLIRWDSYHRNEQLRQEFNRLANVISSLLNAVDKLVVPDLSSVGFYDEDEPFSVAAYRQKANNNKLYAMELE